MIQVFEQDVKTSDRQSSKGNQLKWYNEHIWYKADYTGYEGLSEYVISHLLEYSNLDKGEYVLYDTEEIAYGRQIYAGCKSVDFLQPGWQLITLERLFQSFHGHGLNKSLYTIEDHENRLKFLVDQIERITGLKQFGAYMSKLLTIDAIFKNEDRHTHNVAVLLDTNGAYHFCPIFDNGAALLSDTTLDYPMNAAMELLLDEVEAKTFCRDFDEQLDVAEKLYGQHLRFRFGENEIDRLLDAELYYPKEVKERVKDIILTQRRKYQYLFV